MITREARPARDPSTRSRGLDIGQARVRFRDRSVLDVLDLSLRFMTEHGLSYAKVALVTILPPLLVSIGAGYTLGWGAGWLIALCLAAAAQPAFTVLASRLVFEDGVRVREVLGATLRDAPRVLFVRLIAFLGIVTGLLFLLVPGVWLAVIFSYTSEVLLLERGGIGQSFSRSQRVASSGVGDALLGLVFLVGLWALSVNLADIAGRALIGELLQFRPPAPYWTSGGGALAMIGVFAAIPYLATARFFLYLNVRTRAEGWDIQTRFAALAARGDEGRAALDADDEAA